MGKKTVHGEDEVLNLERRATEKRLQLDRKTVTQAMKVHPWIVKDLLGKCASMGVVERSENGSNHVKETSGGKAPPSLVQLAVEKRAEARRKFSAKTTPPPASVHRRGDSDVDDASEAAPSQAKPTQSSAKHCDADRGQSLSLVPRCQVNDLGDTVFNRKYCTLNRLSVKLFSSVLLSRAEPVVFSPTNIKLFTTYGSGEENQEHLARICERMTGWPTDLRLEGDKMYMRELAWEFLRDNIARGRRGRLLQPPVDFDGKDGDYTLVRADGTSVYVQKNYERIVEPVPRTEFPPFRKLTDLKIEANWSEQRAHVVHAGKHAGHGAGLMLWPFFQKGLQERRSKPMKAICDGDDGRESTSMYQSEEASEKEDGGNCDLILRSPPP